MSDETKVGEGTSVGSGKQEGVSYLEHFRQYWESWAATVHENRESQSSSSRTLGFIQQLLTEFVAYSIIGLCFAGLAYLIDIFSPFVIMIPNKWVALPMLAGAAVWLCFIKAWDQWLRPTDLDDEE